MDLQTLWFILIAVLFTGFLFLEGFDYGVGILLPFVARNDHERRIVINSIGPVWDGNEVWLLTAGGAMFAAFPNWYATLFSGFYLALFLILIALIVRGVAFEFRSKDDRPQWRSLWDGAIFIGSLVPALLWGVAFGNILRGLAIDASMTYVGSFFDLLNPYALITGVVLLGLFILHGALFLQLKTDGVIRERVEHIARRFWLPVTLVAVAFVALSAFETDILTRLNAANVLGLVVAVVALLLTGFFIFRSALRLGLRRHRPDCRRRRGADLWDFVPACYALNVRFRPDDLQCLVQRVYTPGHDGHRPDSGAYCAGLSGLDLLGLSQTPDHRESSRILILHPIFIPVRFSTGQG